MVGGKVIGIAHRHDQSKLPKDDRNDGTTLLHVEDDNSDRCSVRCRGPLRTEIDVGDQVWWQCGKLYWTPKDGPEGRGRQGIDFDVPLEKVGYSH